MRVGSGFPTYPNKFGLPGAIRSRIELLRAIWPDLGRACGIWSGVSGTSTWSTWNPRSLGVRSMPAPDLGGPAVL